MFVRLTWGDVPSGAILTALFLQLDLIDHVTHLQRQHLWKERKVHLGVQHLTLQLDLEIIHILWWWGQWTGYSLANMLVNILVNISLYRISATISSLSQRTPG